MSRYEINVQHDEDDPHWTAMDYTLCHALDLPDHYAAEEAVAAHLRAHQPELVPAVRFDSEAGCFFAYCDTEDGIRQLADAIADLVAAGPHPDAIRGDITASPSFFNLGDVYVPDSWTEPGQ